MAPSSLSTTAPHSPASSLCWDLLIPFHCSHLDKRLDHFSCITKPLMPQRLCTAHKHSPIFFGNKNQSTLSVPYTQPLGLPAHSFLHSSPIFTFQPTASLPPNPTTSLKSTLPRSPLQHLTAAPFSLNYNYLLCPSLDCKMLKNFDCDHHHCNCKTWYKTSTPISVL